MTLAFRLIFGLEKSAGEVHNAVDRLRKQGIPVEDLGAVEGK